MTFVVLPVQLLGWEWPLGLKFVQCQHFPVNCASHGCSDSSLSWFISPGWCNVNLCVKSKTVYNLPHQQVLRPLFAVNELVGPVLYLCLKALNPAVYFHHRNLLFYFRNWDLHGLVSGLWWPRNSMQTICSQLAEGEAGPFSAEQIERLFPVPSFHGNVGSDCFLTHKSLSSLLPAFSVSYCVIWEAFILRTMVATWNCIIYFTIWTI